MLGALTSFVVGSFTTLRSSHKAAQDWQRLWRVVLAFEADVRHAPAELRAWHERPDGIGIEGLVWSLRAGRLVRREAGSVSVVADGIEQFQVRWVVRQGAVIGVEALIRAGTAQLSWYVPVLKGVVA